MQNIRTMGALLGTGAVILALAGCGNGGDTAASDTANAAVNGGDKVANKVADNLGDTANAVANGGAKVVNGAANVGGAVANGAANVVNGAANAGAAVANGAANAGAAVANGAANVGAAASHAALTPLIKTAFGGNKALNGSSINVDTDVAAKTVKLSGTVTSAAQKTLAESIAKQKANGYTVVDNLSVK